MENSLGQLKLTGTVNALCPYILHYCAARSSAFILVAASRPKYAKLPSGKEVTKIVPGNVSVELDATLSFDSNASIGKDSQIIKYKDQGVPKDHILVKIATSWERLQETRILEENHRIRYNMTPLFSLTQAITVAMGASFRSLSEIAKLAGYDYLTIGVRIILIFPLYKSEFPRKLFAPQVESLDIPKKSYLHNKSEIRFTLNEYVIASEYLRARISRSVADANSLEHVLPEKMTAS
ncbi:aldolase [Lojkania enalia]|uniref:Aldolase n=1 Tax=Lojkania enalia TaxID=147567 RepID=A0A9P4MUL5_9PLEO|nr:aldolase [Didymosphaeria enalia]